VLDSKETIRRLKEQCVRLGNPTYMEDAIKVIKMWEKFIQKYGSYHLPGCFGPNRPIRTLTDEVEESFFPSRISAEFKVKIEGRSYGEVHDIADSIRSNVAGVKEVSEHYDKDC